MFFNSYNPMDWYWIVGGDDTRVFSSKASAYLPATDSTYTAWAADNPTTKILDAEQLYEVLLQQWVPPYLATGVQIESTGNSNLNGTYPMDPASQQQITGIATSISAGRGLPGGGSTFRYQGHQFDQTSFLNFATAAENWVYNSYQALGEIVMTGSGSMPEQPVTIA